MYLYITYLWLSNYLLAASEILLISLCSLNITEIKTKVCIGSSNVLLFSDGVGRKWTSLHRHRHIHSECALMSVVMLIVIANSIPEASSKVNCVYIEHIPNTSRSNQHKLFNKTITPVKWWVVRFFSRILDGCASTSKYSTG